MGNLYKKKNGTQKKISEYLNDEHIILKLRIWAENLEIIGVIVLILIIFAGVVSATNSATSLNEAGTTNIPYSANTEIFLFSEFVLGLLKTLTYSILEYCSFKSISYIIRGLASIAQSTKITAQYNFSKQEE